jgi:hypothetical protein
MMRKSDPVLWMGVTFGIALALAAAVLAILGTGEESIRVALDVTARWSFLLFWMAYAGGAIAALFGPALMPLARRGREFGLAFASAHLVHIGLIVWLWLILGRVPFQGRLLVFFAVAIVWTYLLAALSFGQLSKALGPRIWRLLMFLGLNYILLAFARDFVLGTFHSWDVHRYFWQLVNYAPFASLAITAPLLRFAAAAQRRWGRRPIVLPWENFLRVVRNFVILACQKFVPYYRDGKISHCSDPARPNIGMGSGRDVPPRTL